MFARLTRTQGQPDRIEENLAIFTSSALPRIKSLPGYAGSTLAVDRQTGEGQVVTFWESAEALRQSADAAAGIRNETVQASTGKVVSVDEYEIALMERAQAPGLPSFLRVVRGQADPAKLDAMVQTVRDKALPVARTQKGFRALVVSVDRQTGRFVVTGVWDSAEDREASDSALGSVRAGIFADYSAGQPEISRYEVLAVEFVGVGAASN